MRNPKWTIDEMLLGVNCYFEINDIRRASANREKVVALSKLLNELPIHKEREETFRNPAGVCMVLKNIACSDTDTTVGLKHTSKLSQKVFDCYAKNRLALSNVARAISRCLPLPYEYREPENIKSLKYGNILFSYHLYLEEKHGGDILGTVCSLCGRDLSILYGDKARNIMQKHCLIYPEFYANGMKINSDDFCAICPNCHEFIHIDFEAFSISKIKELADNRYV